MHTKHKSRKHAHKPKFHHKKRTTREGLKVLQKVGNSKCPIPERLMATTKFISAPFNLVETSSPFKSFTLNGPYDPDPVLGGSTSAFFTELGLSYYHYICWGSTIKVYCSSDQTADAPPICGVFPSLTTSSGSIQVPLDFPALLNTPLAKWCYTSTFDSPIAVVHNSCKIRDFLGEDVRGDTTYQGQAPGAIHTLESGSNPASLLYWVIGVFNDSGVATDGNIFCTAEIEYWVEYQTPSVPIGYNNNVLTGDLDPKTERVTVSKSIHEVPVQPVKKESLTDSVVLSKLKELIK